MGNRETPASKPQGRKVRKTGKLVLVLVSLLVGFLLCEITLRAIHYSYPIFYTTDTDRGVALRPGMQGWYRKEGVAYVQINSDGLRDREHSRAKPPGTLRIALLGDSYAEALQVPLENAFWYVMQERLKDCRALAGRQVEVINFGVSGYGTAQELLTLEKHVWDYSPDIVLLAVTTNNDITDNTRALKKTDEIPYFVFRDNQLVLDNSFLETKAFRLRQSALNRFGRWIRDHSRVIQVLHQAQVAIKSYFTSGPSAKPQSAPGATANEPNAEEVGIDNLIYREPRDEVWQDAWRVTEALLVRMRDEVKDHGARFFVVTLSNGIQVHPDPNTRRQFVERLGASDLFYPDLRIRALGDRENFAVFNLAPALQAYAEKNKVFLHGFGAGLGNGHWNNEGHRVAGEMLAQRLCEEP